MKKVNKVYGDILEVPIDSKYDKIISIAVLEHLIDLPLTLAYIGLLMKNYPSSFFAGIPAEGKLLWKLAWKFTTGLHFKLKYGLNYSVLMQYEHVNSCKEIVSLCQYFFMKVNIKRFPFGIPALSLYYCIHCAQPNFLHIDEYLNKIGFFYEKRYYCNN